MFLINDVVWAEYLTPPERYLIEQCFASRDMLLGVEDESVLDEYRDIRGLKIYDSKLHDVEGGVIGLDQSTKKEVHKALEALSRIMFSIKVNSETRYKQQICNICYNKPPKPIISDIKKVLMGYCHFQDIHSSEHFDRKWSRLTKERAITALTGDCDTQLEALQMWSAENTDILPDKIIQRYQALATKTIENFVEVKYSAFRSKF